MFSVFNKLSCFFKTYWKRYTFAVVFLIIASALGLIPPKLIGYTIDQIRFDTLTTQILLTLLLIYLSIIVVHYLISYTWSYLLFGGAIILEKQIEAQNSS